MYHHGVQRLYAVLAAVAWSAIAWSAGWFVATVLVRERRRPAVIAVLAEARAS